MRECQTGASAAAFSVGALANFRSEVQNVPRTVALTMPLSPKLSRAEIEANFAEHRAALLRATGARGIVALPFLFRRALHQRLPDWH